MRELSPTVVTLPTNVEEAEAMQKLGYAWLKQNAPEKLLSDLQSAEFSLTSYLLDHTGEVFEEDSDIDHARSLIQQRIEEGK